MNGRQHNNCTAAICALGPLSILARKNGEREGGFKQVLRTMVNLASLLGILASATTLVVLVALGRIAFGRHLASLHHLASLGIHRTRRRGGGGGSGSGRSTSSLPLAHSCCVRSIFLPPVVPSFPVPLVFLPSLSLLSSLYSHLPIARPPIGSVCLGKGYANVQIADHRTGKSSQLSGSPQTLPDGATSMPEAVQPSLAPQQARQEASLSAKAGSPPSLSLFARAKTEEVV